MFRLGGDCKQIFKCNIPNLIHQQRSLQAKPWKSAEHFRKEDKIDEGYTLIYSPPKTQLLITANSIFTCTGVFSTFLLSSYCFTRFYTENGIQLDGIVLPLINAIGSIIALYFIRSFPIRIYRKKDQYTAVLAGISGAKRKFHFQKGDVAEKNLSADDKLPFLEAKVTESSWFKIKGKRLFLVTRYFERPRDLFDMFANSRKYVMQLKKMVKEEEKKLQM